MTTPIRFPSSKRYKSENDFLNVGVYRWLCRLAGTELYRHFKTGEVLPTAEELARWLDTLAYAKVRPWLLDYQERPAAGRWTGAQYERQLERAAAFCLENYDPVMVYARASKGGRNSHRGQKVTVAEVLALDGLTVAEKARALKCSPRTIQNRHADLRDYDPVIAGVYDRELVYA